MSYSRLLYLLYVVERHMLTNRGTVFIGDDIVAMNGIPTLKNILHLCRRDVFHKAWNDEFRYPQPLLLSGSGIYQSCPDFIEDVVARTDSNYKYCSDDEIVAVLRSLPEVSGRDKCHVFSIRREDILRYNGFSDKEIQKIMNNKARISLEGAAS